MATYLRVKNWAEFQHYKDRNPPWIKLHRVLLDDYEFTSLRDEQKAHLMLLWIFASQNDGRIPNDPQFLANRINANEPIDIDSLIEHGFLLNEDGAPAAKEKWHSRYISADLRSEVMMRDRNKCTACASKVNLEIDHKVPVSKGGKSEKENLQVLCRSCNRSKRVRSAEQVATQIIPAAYPEAEAEERRVEETPKPKKNGHDRKTAPPGEFEVTEEMWAWAQEQGVAHARVESETAKFLDHHKAKGSKFIDWDAAWRTWMRKSVEFAGRAH
jgi:hypothetical protein